MIKILPPLRSGNRVGLVSSGRWWGRLGRARFHYWGGFSLRCFSFLFRNFLRGEFEHGFSHFLAGLEFHDGTRRNRHIGSGSIRVAPNPGFSNFDFENPKIAQFHFSPLRHGIRDIIQRLLNDCEYILLHETRLLADSHYQVTLCHSGCVLVVLGGWRAIA